MSWRRTQLRRQCPVSNAKILSLCIISTTIQLTFVMEDCCHYTGTCRGCIGSGKFWLTTRNETNCCASQPQTCGLSIAKMAETLAQCKDPSVYTTSVITGAVLGCFFMIAIVVVVLLVKKGGCLSPFRSFRRRRHGDDTESMIPMVTYRRSGSVYSLNLTENHA